VLQTRCVKIKLKSGMVGRAREWAAEINRRKDEAHSVLRKETVFVECAFLDSHEGGDFLIYFMKAKSFDVSLPGEESAASISSFHQAFKHDTWESGTKLPCLIDLDLTDELNKDG
jgi:hypothetical protein